MQGTEYKFINMLGQERGYTLREDADPESVACKMVELSGMPWKVVKG